MGRASRRKWEKRAVKGWVDVPKGFASMTDLKRHWKAWKNGKLLNLVPVVEPVAEEHL